ncbi:MAG: hypothetical protein KKB51_21390 [Candidatus Riflebacteria bacterium]|nr:hypothetical protein [Candidatus Riflebacteria bacterium]
MENTPEFKLTEIFQLARKHRFVGLCCLVLCLFLEVWFYNYPPRGVVGEDMLIAGSNMGNSLVDLNSLWARIVNDDALMLEIIDRSAICKHTEQSKRLSFLKRSIRQDLKFQIENNTIVKISFKRPASNQVRPFLNYFTDTFVKKLDAIGMEGLELRRQSASVQFANVIERMKFVASIFSISGIHELLSDYSNKPLQTDKILAVFQTVNAGSNIGRVLLGELLPQYTAAGIHYEKYFRNDMQFLDLFPRSSVILTSRNMPATPVQPFYELIFILCPVAVSLMYLSLLIVLRARDSQDRCDASC